MFKDTPDGETHAYIHCEKCLAYYTPGYPHDCPPWLVELVKQHNAKESTTKKT